MGRKSKNKVYGYVRVSSKEQNEDRQLIALAPYKIPKPNIYIDKKSGCDFDRTEYQNMLGRLQEGDLLIVKSIDRLGRNYREIMEQWRLISQVKGADIKVIDMPLLDTTRCKDLLGTFISDLVLQVLSFVAENERENIRQRQKEGIEAAKARGVHFGRPIKTFKVPFESVVEAVDDGEMDVDIAIRFLGISRSTYYRRKREYTARRLQARRAMIYGEKGQPQVAQSAGQRN